MKLEIDFTLKTIKVLDEITLKELLDTLESINIEYTEYKIVGYIPPFIMHQSYPSWEYIPYPLTHYKVQYNPFDTILTTT